MRIDEELFALAAALGRSALARGVTIVTAESCTGGLLAGAVTAVAGSSEWFERGFVTYSDAAKVEDLFVPAETIDRFGAVSEQTAMAMAEGALRASRAKWSASVTGIAGPSGGTPAKPVGTVCFAWAGPVSTSSVQHLLPGDRADIRRASVGIALRGIIDRLA
jgi:nicotinamide-nucleotide amidase